MSREQQLSSAFAAAYRRQGMAPPTVATQDWYERQGYAVFAVERAGYRWVSPGTGQVTEVDYVFLRKGLVGSGCVCAAAAT